ncbi:serine/threonine-protein kinase pelle-like [Leptopilina heterotoma]|uniref:serine/threonine-protein kinase pelle-like n=1 Tax=Leptopilina heterotoma TaxID=63436 RepID=UPI001CA7F959|nr:serine/threonine-protein kinase pelle-like [Leptopilina heterotoma]
MNDNNNEQIYIYEIPYFIRMELCGVLNQNDKWEELGIGMQFNFDVVNELRKESNPTDALLTKWSQYNHKILELFILLSRMQHYQAMNILRPLVDPKYHLLIDKGEGNLRKKVKEKLHKKTKENDMSIDTKNFNNASPTQNLIQKVVLRNTDDEEWRKIINEPKKFMSPPHPQSYSNNLLHESSIDNNLPLAMYDELTIGTDNWNKMNILGKGGFGIVYRGVWKHTDVAIKKIERRCGKSDESYATQLQQSLREIKILNSHPHDNILALYAYSLNGDAPCLLYQLMPNGSLEDRLLRKQKTEPLSCGKRYNIAIGTARGLQYLHTIGGKPLIHGDIKSANILLDKYFEPKIGDFGLAREGPKEDSIKVVSKIFGTRPYLPEDFISSRNLSTKIDTYSFGIVIFELATGLPAYDHNRSECKFLRELMNKWEDKENYILMDKMAGYNHVTFTYLVTLGKWCTNKLAQNRPEMDQVYKNLSDSKNRFFILSR